MRTFRNSECVTAWRNPLYVLCDYRGRSMGVYLRGLSVQGGVQTHQGREG
jgi:hypothetical protein